MGRPWIDSKILGSCDVTLSFFLLELKADYNYARISIRYTLQSISISIGSPMSEVNMTGLI